MDQSVLVDTDVDERPEIGDVRNDPFKNHSRREVLKLMHALFELSRLELRSRVASGLLQLSENILHRRLSEAFVREIRSAQRPQKRRIAEERFHATTRSFDDAFD